MGLLLKKGMRMVLSAKYKDMLCPSRGGSIERALTHFRTFEGHPDPLVRALASERLFILKELIRQFMPSAHKSSSSGPRTLPNHALETARLLLRRLSRDIKDAAAAPCESAALFSEHYGHLLTSTCVDMLSNVDPAPASSAPGASNKRPAPATSTSAKKSALAPPFECVDVPASVEEARDILARGRGATLGFCRNCFLLLKGKVVHTLSECAALGNECVVSCQNPKCKRAKHWRSACPFSKFSKTEAK